MILFITIVQVWVDEQYVVWQEFKIPYFTFT